MPPNWKRFTVSTATSCAQSLNTTPKGQSSYWHITSRPVRPKGWKSMTTGNGKPLSEKRCPCFLISILQPSRVTTQARPDSKKPTPPQPNLLDCEVETADVTRTTGRTTRKSPGPRGGDTQREADAAGQTLRTALRRLFPCCCSSGGTHRAADLRPSGSQNLYCRDRRLRMCLHRLRQRRLARHLPPVRHQARRSPGRGNQSSVPQQPGRHLHGCDGKGGPAAHRMGLGSLCRRLQQ